MGSKIKVGIDMKLKQLSHNDKAALKAFLTGDCAGNSLLDALENPEHTVYGILVNGTLVGAAEIEHDRHAFLYVYIVRQFRKKGFGAMAVKLCEKELQRDTLKSIETYYLSGDENAKTFANKLGYAYRFSSALMRYNGGAFDLPSLPVRSYVDEDYTAAQQLSARAFHEMRLRVGGFPDSVVQKPTEAMREAWNASAKERFVYVLDNEIIGHSHLEGDAIDSVSIKPEVQGRGVGRLFVKYLCNKILENGHNSVTLYCVVGNYARHLYDSLGFQQEYIEEYAVKTF